MAVKKCGIALVDSRCVWVLMGVPWFAGFAGFSGFFGFSGFSGFFGFFGFSRFVGSRVRA